MSAAPPSKPSLGTRVARAIKSSPSMVRKAFKKLTTKAGPGMKGCHENGWLYKDDDVKVGVTYKVQYLGSVEVAFDQSDQDANQKAAETAMRALRDFNKEAHKELPVSALTVAMKSITLRTGDGSNVVMRHSTTRVAYSTVDSGHPRSFAYVAVVKGSDLALCHVFNTKSKKQGYEMTFVCAQAFDLNLQHWQSNQEAAAAEAAELEKSDIQPPEAWQRKCDGAKAPAAAPRETPSPTLSDAADAVAESGYTNVPASPARSEKFFFAARGGDDVVAQAGRYFASLGVQLVEGEDDAADDAFAELARRRSQRLATGVAAEAWEGESVGTDDVGGGDGYMTVGTTDFNFADDAF